MMPGRSTVRSAFLIAGSLTMTLWLAVGSALAAPAETEFALASERGPDYAQEARFGAVRQVGLGLVQELYGSSGLLGLRAASSVVGPVAPGDDPTRPGGPTTPIDPTPSPSPTDKKDNRVGPLPSPDPTDDTKGPTLKAERPILVVDIRADRTSAAPGDDITYTVTARNKGTATLSSATLESHVPQGTTFQGSAACDGETAQVNEPFQGKPAVCVNTDSVVGPGESDPDTHKSSVRSNIEPGGYGTWSFTVRVRSDVQSGTVIENHAHGSGPEVESVNSRVVRVVVS